MSSTRYAEPDAPLSQNRYMSSPEYGELRGVIGNVAAAKAALVMSARKRSLIYFLQALSLEPGGLREVARKLVEMFPKRGDAERVNDIAGALMDICVNPRVLILDGPDDLTRAMDVRRVKERHQELDSWDIKETRCHYFKDLDEALFEFQERYTRAASESFAKTTVAKKVVQTLNACLDTRRMVLVEGESDTGKSTAAEGWCRMHKGEARYVRLEGITNKTVFFRSIARALGLASSYMRTATQMQARVTDMLQRSGLMLVLDESQYAFAQGERIYSRPELVDYIYTALCNHSVPVALIASPLFSKRLHQAEQQTIWNSDQFRRRIYRYEILPRVPTRNDIELVVKHHLPDANEAARNYLAGYAATCITKRTNPQTQEEVKSSFAYTAIADTLADATQIAKDAGRERVTLNDLMEAVKTFRVSSEMSKRLAFDTPRTGRKRSRVSAAVKLDLTAREDGLESASPEEDFTSRRDVAARETHPATSGRTPAFSEA